MRLKPVTALLAALSATVAPLSRSAEATLIVLAHDEKIVTSSDTIVLGDVQQVRSRWEGGRIVNDVLVRVGSTIKGRSSRSITVVAPGGSVGGIAMHVFGAATFRAGDRSVLFLRRSGPTYRIVRLARGKVDVIRTADGREIVHRPAPDGSTRDVALADFVRAVKGLAQKVRP